MIQSIFSAKFTVTGLIIAAVYFNLAIFFMNSPLVIETVSRPFSGGFKLDLLFSLPGATWTIMDGAERLILVLTSLLTGANLALILQSIGRLGRLGRLHLAVGGNSLLSIIGNGCASCGLSVLSILGFSGFLVFLPLKGTELNYLALILLSISLYFMIKNGTNDKFCKISPKK